MIIFKKAKDLSDYTRQQKESGHKIGFVPTMGALHAGHLSLIGHSRKMAAITVCSIFVNPTQFNNPEDLRHYPVTIEKDIEQLVAAGCDVLFLPSVDEVYPASLEKKHYDLGAIEMVLEGSFRPGHFQGVCQVVDRLLDLVRPHYLFMGQKDFQQCIVVKKLLELTGRDASVQLVIVPTVREESGLAMSSRNLRLDKEQREKATVLYRELELIRQGLSGHDIAWLKTEARKQLEANGFLVDYVDIVHAEDLSPANDRSGKLVALVAASTGKVRLIDNLILN